MKQRTLLILLLVGAAGCISSTDPAPPALVRRFPDPTPGKPFVDRTTSAGVHVQILVQVDRACEPLLRAVLTDDLGERSENFTSYPLAPSAISAVGTNDFVLGHAGDDVALVKWIGADGVLRDEMRPARGVFVLALPQPKDVNAPREKGNRVDGYDSSGKLIATTELGVGSGPTSREKTCGF